MRQLFHDPQLQKTFIEQGFVIVDLLSPEEVAKIWAELENLRPDDQFAPDRSSSYHCTFLDTNVDYKRRTNELIAEMFQPKMDQVLVDFTILNGNFYVKPPQKGEFEVHQNWMHIDQMKDTTCTIWCPLVEVSRNNGGVEVVPRSHKIVPDVACVHVDYYFKNFENALKEKYLQPLELKPGQAAIFDDGLIHWSAINQSDQPRYAIQILTYPREITPVIYYLDKSAPEKGFEMFEINTEYFILDNIHTMRDRPTRLRSLGFKPNPNRLISEEEFLELMERGDEIRRKYYEGG